MKLWVPIHKLALSGLILGTVALLSPVTEGFYLDGSPLGESLLDTSHFPIFIILTLCLFVIARRTFPRWPTAIATATAGALAFGTEIIQETVSGRTLSYQDFISNLLGVTVATAGIIAFHPKPGALSRRTILALAAVTTASLLIVSAPVIQVVRSTRDRDARFPVLGTFEHSWERLFWLSQGNTTLSKKDSVLAVQTPGGDWCGLYFLAGHQDWNPYNSIVFDATNHGEPFLLGIRVDGPETNEKKARLTGQVLLKQGTTRYAILLGELAGDRRSEILRGVTRLVLHTGQGARPTRFSLDNIQLAH